MALQARSVVFGHKREHALYEGLSLQVEPGERVALAAPSGFGKTTLCQLLAGYLQPWSGEVLVDGAPHPRRGAARVQLIGQHPERVLDPRMRMESSLAEAGPFDERTFRSLGIRQEWLRRFPHELSGGELQRFCIARAFAADPRYLVADEISTMLDALTQARIWRFICEEAERKNMGVLFVSHDAALTSRIATRVIDLSGCAGAVGGSSRDRR